MVLWGVKESYYSSLDKRINEEVDVDGKGGVIFKGNVYIVCLYGIYGVSKIIEKKLKF